MKLIEFESIGYTFTMKEATRAITCKVCPAQDVCTDDTAVSLMCRSLKKRYVCVDMTESCKVRAMNFDIETGVTTVTPIMAAKLFGVTVQAVYPMCRPDAENRIPGVVNVGKSFQARWLIPVESLSVEPLCTLGRRKKGWTEHKGDK